MGVLTDFVVAPCEHAPEVMNSQWGDPRWPREDSKGVDHVLLGRLDAAVRDGEYDKAFIARIVCLGEASEDGPWVYEVPTELVQRLVGLTDASAREMLERWARAEEFKLRGSTSEHVELYFRVLTRLSKLAAERGHSLLMWMSL